MACAINYFSKHFFFNYLISMYILFFGWLNYSDVVHIRRRRRETGYLIMKWLKCIIKCANGQLHT